MTPTSDKLRVYYPAKNLTSDGAALPLWTTTAGSEGGGLTSIIASALSQADDYWAGAIGWFEGNTTTAALQGQFFHVKSSTSASRTLTLTQDLPAIPQAGDTFRLVLGGNYRSSTEIVGMLVGGVLPEFKPVAGVQVTGVTIRKASAFLGAGTLTINYRRALQQVFIKMGTQAYGVGLDVSNNVTSGIVFAADGQGFIQIDVNAAQLATADRTDTWTLDYPQRTLTPDYEGYETTTNNGGKTRYRLECVKNTDPVDAMVDLSVYTGRPAGATTTIDYGQSLGLLAAGFDVTDASDWPTRSFWIKNKSANNSAGDCRYVLYRSGNTLYCMQVDWATLPFTNGTNQIRQGDVLTGYYSSATAVVDQVLLTSGSWSTSNATGTLLLKKVVGTFTSSDYLRVNNTNMARATADAILGLRGYTAVNWSSGQTIELMSDVDLGANKPLLNQYENPASATLAPALTSVTFQDAYTQSTAIDLGNLSAGKLHGVWRREWIMDGHQSRPNIDADTRYSWS
ncbi:MAG: hypothetical protein FWD61_01090 [Phycisphaerales bacterium]|nr:hypothetical protein [Phycisphaerales bacterium]